MRRVSGGWALPPCPWHSGRDQPFGRDAPPDHPKQATRLTLRNGPSGPPRKGPRAADTAAQAALTRSLWFPTLPHRCAASRREGAKPCGFAKPLLLQDEDGRLWQIVVATVSSTVRTRHRTTEATILQLVPQAGQVSPVSPVSQVLLDVRPLLLEPAELVERPHGPPLLDSRQRDVPIDQSREGLALDPANCRFRKTMHGPG